VEEDEGKRSASLNHHQKQQHQQSDSELFSFLSAMGFSMEQIESAVQSLRRDNKGPNVDIDVDAVVALLLSHPEGEEEGESMILPLVAIKDSPDNEPTTDRRQQQQQQQQQQQSGERDEFMKIEVTPGNFAPVLKGRQTLSAINNGTAVSVRCTICIQSLQCCPEAEYVLCPDCDVVSPILMSVARRSSDNYSFMSSQSHRINRRMSTGGMIGSIGLGKKVDNYTERHMR
jgi:hypothetical protein